jgi:hypothetical protein
MHYLSVLAIFKNETMNLKVWLDHYIWQGVEHFYLIDNGSTDNPMEILQEYIDKGFVTYVYGDVKHRQQQYYKDVFNLFRLKEKTVWLAVCDLDEFFFGTQKRLSKVLKTHENYNMVLSNWLMFGSDGLVEQPKDIRTGILYREEPIHILTKYIFKTVSIPNTDHIWIHHLENVDNTYTVTDNEEIHLNHYPIQSLEFFQKVKMTRGAADVPWSENVRDMNYFNNMNQNKTYKDLLLPELIANPPEDY